MPHLVSGLRESVPPDPQDISRDGDWDCHREKDPEVRRSNWVTWLRVEGEGVVHAEERLGGVLVRILACVDESRI